MSVIFKDCKFLNSNELNNNDDESNNYHILIIYFFTILYILSYSYSIENFHKKYLVIKSKGRILIYKKSETG